jgi:hypothetical protein
MTFIVAALMAVGLSPQLDYSRPKPPKPKPVAVVAPVVVEPPVVEAAAAADVFYGPSTNAYVDPWGCEADHPQDVSPTGKYWGKYQFDYSTWVAHGGNPETYGSAGESEQDEIASRVTYDAWPNC